MKVSLSRSVMTLAMLGIFVVLVFIASGYPPNARFMPFVVGIPAIGLCILQLVLDQRGRPTALDAGPPAPEPGVRNVGPEVPHEMLPVEPQPVPSPRETVRRELVLWAYFLALVGCVLLFGFWATIPIFLIAFLRFQARARWGMTLALGIAATVVLYLALEQAFRIELHRGFVTEYVRDQMGRTS
jgi:hypothetical protein